MRKTVYEVFGYDKDADVYKLICVSPLPEFADMIAVSLVKRHVNAKIYRPDMDKPFDWFVVAEHHTAKISKIYTAERPDGKAPDTDEYVHYSEEDDIGYYV